MNIKALKSGLGPAAVILFAAVLFTVPLRTIHYFSLIESNTGFYSEVTMSVYLFFAAVAAAIVTFTVMAFIKRKSLSYSTHAATRPGFGALAGLTAAGFIFDAVACVQKFTSDKYMNLESISPDEASSLTTASNLLKFQTAAAVIAFIYFAVVCLVNLTGKKLPKAASFLSVIPVIWGMLKLVFRFMETISYVRVSDLMLDMLMLAFEIMFLMAFAQLNSGVNAKNCEWKVAAYGLSAALLGFICFVPRLIITIAGNADLIYTSSSLEYCDICIALFALCTVFTRFGEKEPQETGVVPVESAASEG